MPGLTREDFEVLQDGVPQTITNFYAVSGGKVAPGGRHDGLARGARGRGRCQSEVPDELKARYIIYVDNLNIQPQNRNRMFKRLKEFVQQTVGTQAEAMVVVFNRSLKVRRKFTSDPCEIIKVLEEIERETGGGDVPRSASAATRSSGSTTRRAPPRRETIARPYAQALPQRPRVHGGRRSRPR